MREKILDTITQHPRQTLTVIFDKAGVDPGPGGTVVGKMLRDGEIVRRLDRREWVYEVAK